ncbi:beta-ketoacyl-[acyl-carrier-protein] synthase family protein [Curtobacterium sp. Leaf261]|uniref:beta-ketoacyl-[acyl-carrier-protein] synthase family protein n=1 Tax=Curtobacterium sp. Leaf261 TaxID=1736311 RepID=UPI0006F2EEFF|nr:beta-ketoacyl-[acyl-carrier-protein] synthase family protein [Curtobacterium sp. Leaf261]KQO65009.1 3-oxoacyl-ACP synthase [Curtobacterium sp. Leaf261]
MTTTHTVVVTGVGSISPLGATATESWEALLAGKSGISTIEEDWVERYDLPVHFAGQARKFLGDQLTRQEVKRLDPGSQLSLVAAREAWADAGIDDAAIDPERLIVDWATGIGGLNSLLDGWDTLRERGPRRMLPMTVPMLMANGPAAAIEMAFGARGGARTYISACASSTESLAEAYRHVSTGVADVVIAGGCEAALHPMPLAAFSAMQALSRRNDDPEGASRPYDVTRDGFVLGDGAAALILETKEHALARGARIYAEIAGGGITSDAFHITAPDPEGSAAARAVLQALGQADASPSDVVHVNAHATSTSVGDIAEYHAMRRVFGDGLDDVVVSATKASTGHLLGGAGAIEAMFTVLALHHRVAPPTINLTDQEPEIVMDVAREPRKLADGDLLAISNSFGFGGHNAVVAIRTA